METEQYARAQSVIKAAYFGFETPGKRHKQGYQWPPEKNCVQQKLKKKTFENDNLNIIFILYTLKVYAINFFLFFSTRSRDPQEIFLVTN